MERNPTQFQLPSELTCTTALPGSSKRRRKEELLGKPFRRPQHELDSNGLVPLPVKVCFSCNRSCRLAPLIQCDYCPLLFHMDCLDPPLTALPAGKWMCPNHVEHLVLNQRSLSLSSRCQLFDQFQDRMSQHAVKLDFLRQVHRQNAPNRRSLACVLTITLWTQVPDAIKSQYQNPPSTLLPARVRQLELVCSGVPNRQPSKHLTTEAEQQEWLQDVIALQCSIARHLAIKQKASAEWASEQKASCKSCTASDDVKPQASLERTSSSPDPSSKPCTTSDGPPGALFSLEPPAELSACKCSVTPCQSCRKPNGPAAEACQRPKANGPVDCNSGSDPCRQAELQHRLKPSMAPPAAAPAAALANHIGAETIRLKPSMAPPAAAPDAALANHIGAETIKKEPESVTEACAQKTCPAAPTIWQQNHRTQAAPPEESMSRDDKGRSDTPPTGHQDHSPVKLGSSSSTPGTLNRSLLHLRLILV
uniref:PHD-type domain-containing protein n=1 Tax=Mola mola TaxID=94237 RepID=A0A3Q3WTT0_MOLML